MYLCGSRAAKASDFKTNLSQLYPLSRGTIEFQPLDLDDLNQVSSFARSFLKLESRLDGLFNNAGVMLPPEDSKTVQGYEYQLGVNAIGHHLLASMISPVLISTASRVPAGGRADRLDQ